MRLDEESLTRWGRRVGREVDTPVLLCLQGPLGAGKSVLARAVGEGAGVRATMPSPSFNLLFRYSVPDREGAGERQVVHLDLYRLDRPEELWELGWEELGGPGQIVLLEWPERAGDLLPVDYWRVELATVPDRPRLRDCSLHRVGAPPTLPRFSREEG